MLFSVQLQNVMSYIKIIQSPFSVSKTSRIVMRNSCECCSLNIIFTYDSSG